jgi:hypothetical protein
MIAERFKLETKYIFKYELQCVKYISGRVHLEIMLVWFGLVYGDIRFHVSGNFETGCPVSVSHFNLNRKFL